MPLFTLFKTLQAPIKKQPSDSDDNKPDPDRQARAKQQSVRPRYMYIEDVPKDLMDAVKARFGQDPYRWPRGLRDAYQRSINRAPDEAFAAERKNYAYGFGQGNMNSPNGGPAKVARGLDQKNKRNGAGATAVISGDTSWPAYLVKPLYEGYIKKEELSGNRVIARDAPSRQDVKNMLGHVKKAYFWGHGDKGMLYFGKGDDDYLTDQDIDAIAETRRRNGLGKLESLDIDQCMVCGDPRLVNRLLKIAKVVRGYEGWTVNPSTLVRGVKREWSSPRPFNGAIDTPENYKKPEKVRGKVRP